MRVLVVDDDPVSTSLLEAVLERESCIVESTNLGADALELARHYEFDAVILDLQLPDISGTQVLRRLRALGSNVPVLILSSLDDRDQKIRLMVDDGADDYLTKPFDKRELLARLRVAVRRARGHAASQIRIGRLTLDLAARTVVVDEVPIKVTAKEYAILELLALRRGTTLSKETFLDHLYGGRDEPEQKIIDVFICKLRKKIAAVTGGTPGIETVWGQGYVLREPIPAIHGLAEEAPAFFGPDLTPEALQAHRARELDELLLQLLPHTTEACPPNTPPAAV